MYKEIHTLFLHDHHHGHEVEHNDVCNHSTHMHEIEHVTLDCSICDFHFSPSEKVASAQPSSVVIPSTQVQYFFNKNITNQSKDFCPMLRAPPSHI